MIRDFQKGSVDSESSFGHIFRLSLFSYPLYLASAVMPTQSTQEERIPSCTLTHIPALQACGNWTIRQSLWDPKSTRNIPNWFQLIPAKNNSIRGVSDVPLFHREPIWYMYSVSAMEQAINLSRVHQPVICLHRSSETTVREELKICETADKQCNRCW